MNWLSPRISIIIPTYNRSASLMRTLESIASFQGNDFEVLVIDNGSTDDTSEAFSNRWTDHPRFKYYYDPVPGLLTGRHRGAIEAEGEILCFIDDDVLLGEYWLDAVRNNLLQGHVLMTGPTMPVYLHEQPDWLPLFWYQEHLMGSFCSWLSLLDLGRERRTIDPDLVWGLNFIIRTDAFWKLKGFHPDNVPSAFQMFQGNGETGLTRKAKQYGLTALYDPLLEVKHVIPASRLTRDYFGHRAFYQGVCDSYQSLRDREPKPLRASLAGKTMMTIRKWLLKPKEDAMVRFTREEYEKGKNFHQGWYGRSAVIREWVHREDYLDYALPLEELSREQKK